MLRTLLIKREKIKMAKKIKVLSYLDNAIVFSGLTLSKGVNMLEQGQVDIIVKRPFFQQFFKTGKIVIESQKNNSSEKAEKKNEYDKYIQLVEQIKSMNIKEVTEALAKIDSLDILEAIYDADERSGVKKAVTNRIDELVDLD
jgi:hypothetical protein